MKRRACQSSERLVKFAVLLRSARPESGREAREMFLIEPLARTQSERRRRLALASGFRLLRLSGIDRLDAPAARGGARVDRPRWLRILTITGGSSMPALEECSKGQAMIFKAPPQLGQSELCIERPLEIAVV